MAAEISMRAMILGVAALLAAGPVQAKVTAVIVQWGEVSATEDGTAPPELQGHGLSPSGQISNMRFLSRDDHITAQLCRGLGFEAWLAAGPGETLPERAEVRFRHPTFTREDGATSDLDDGPTGIINGRASGAFTFDHTWELMPGSWRIELVLDDVVLAAKDFTVTLPPPGEAKPACDGPPST